MNLSIDKSIKISKSDLIDIDCIDQSVEMLATLQSMITLLLQLLIYIGCQ